MSLAGFSLRRPYTVVAVTILICLMAAGALRRMPTDIFPEINIPVVSVVWTYNGMSAPEIQDRIVALHERQLASLVDDISRIEANSYNGVGVIKVYLHEGANVSRAISQLASSALVVLKYMPRNITPPLILRYGATDVPIIQLSVSSDTLTDTALNDLGQNIIRPDLAVVRGASVPYPYGGKPRVIMVSLNQEAMQSRGITPADVTRALTQQNIIMPSGDVKIGSKDYTVAMNNSPDVIATINAFPIKKIGGKTVFVRDVAHVHDGFQVQTNSVSQNGLPGALMLVRKTGGVSTLAVIEGIKKILPDIKQLLPPGVSLKPIFDQSIFVNAALNSVIMGGLMAAGLTMMMILLFLGNYRLTFIILVSIPLSIVVGVVLLYVSGQTLNTMTLGGFALAVGVLVDDGTVRIENIERHVSLGKPLEKAILDGTAEVAVATILATTSVSVVYIPVFLLYGTAKYLFSPLSLSVIFSLYASLLVSFTIVPLLFKILMKSQVHSGHEEGHANAEAAPTRRRFDPLGAAHRRFERGFLSLREGHRNTLAWMVDRPLATVIFFAVLIGASLTLYPKLGMDFFPQIDAGQMRLHVRAPPGTKLEQTQHHFAEVEGAIRQIVGDEQIDVILDNIGLPYSGINIALSDTATVGPMDGEILISLKEKHTSTPEHVADLRRELPKRFPQLQFFFQPADIVNQVLNFGQPAPIDIRVSGPKNDEAYALASKLAADLNHVPGVVDSHVFQVPDAPALTVDIDRELARYLGLGQKVTADNLLVSLNNSLQVAPNFWLNPRNEVSYPLVVQTPTYQINSAQDLWTLPVTAPQAKDSQLLMNIAKFGRNKVPMVVSQLNIRPVFDVHADVQGRDLNSAANAIEDVIEANKPPEASAIKVTLSGQVETMRESFSGLFAGMALAVVLVFLLLVINFQSVTDSLIVLMAVPFAICGAMWMLFVTQTHISVPALMGTLMCIGLSTANSILVVTFCNQRMEAGADSRTAAIEGAYTRLRPVLMTAGAMILGMIPMAFGVGEGGEQNAPLARAVIGGLFFATAATLLFVPTLYRLWRREGKETAQKGDKPLSQSDIPENGRKSPKNGDRPFDGYDDVAEGIIEPHSHPKIPTTYKPGTGRRLIIFAVALAITLGGGYILVNTIKARDSDELAASTEAKSNELPTVEVVTVALAPGGEALRLPAEASGWYNSTIYARVSGYLTEWRVDIGDKVKKNEVLAVIDTPELDAQLEASRAQLKASEAETKVREADAEFAKTTYERWSGSAKGVVSEQEREDKKANYASGIAKLHAAQARVNLDKSNVDRLNFMAQYKQVLAPYEGIITERRIDIGDLVTAGSTSNTTPLFGISQYDRIRVFANVPQQASGDARLGTPVKIFAAEYPNQVFEGKVTRTSESIDPKARTLRVEADIPNADLKLLPGMYLQMEFNLKSKTYVQIPASALLFRTAGPQVALILPDSKVKFQDVRIARDNGNTVEISSGLSEGDRVALNISNQIIDGTKVTVRENNKMAAR